LRRALAFSSVVARGWMRSKSALFWTTVFPLMLLLIFGAVFGETRAQTYPLLVVNEDLYPSGQPTELSSALVKALNSTGVIEVHQVDPGQNLEEAMRSKGIYRALVIHRGFEEELTKVSVAGRVDVMVSTLEYVLANFGNVTSPENRSQMESGLSALKAFRANLSSGTVEITYVRDPNDRASSAVEGVIRSFLAAFNLRLLGANESVTVSPADLGFRRTRPIDYYLPGILMAFVMTNGVLGVAPPLAEMRKSRQLKRLAVTPLKLSELLTGFMLVQVLMSSVLAVLLVAVGWAVFRPSFTLNPYALALTVVASLFFTSLGLLIGSALKELEAVVAASNVIVFPMMFLSGAFWPLEFAPPIMRTIAGFTPLYYFAEGLRSVGVYGELGPSLTAFAIGLVASPVLLFIGSSLLGRELAE